jgi:hypothetical protein
MKKVRKIYGLCYNGPHYEETEVALDALYEPIGHGNWIASLYRVGNIALGGIIALLGGYFLWPQWEPVLSTDEKGA